MYLLKKFNKNSIRGLDLAIVVAPLSLLGYSMTYLYQFFYNYYFHIPSMFIEIQLMQVVEAVFAVSLILGIIFLIEYLLRKRYIYLGLVYICLFSVKIMEGVINFICYPLRHGIRAFFRNKILISFFMLDLDPIEEKKSKNPDSQSFAKRVMKYFFELENEDNKEVEKIDFLKIPSEKMVYKMNQFYKQLLLIILLGILGLLGLSFAISLISPEEIPDTWIGIGELQQDWIYFFIAFLIITTLYIFNIAMEKNKVVEAILILLFIFLSFSSILGYYQARNKDEYLVIEPSNKETLLVLKTYQNKFLVAPYQKSLSKIGPSYKIYEVNINNQEQFQLLKVKINDLTLEEVPTIEELD